MKKGKNGEDVKAVKLFENQFACNQDFLEISEIFQIFQECGNFRISGMTLPVERLKKVNKHIQFQKIIIL
jgi:hypothetical protein